MPYQCSSLVLSNSLKYYSVGRLASEFYAQHRLVRRVLLLLNMIILSYANFL